MRTKLILFFYIISCLSPVLAQKAKIDSLLQKVSMEKDGTRRLVLMQYSMNITSETDPLLDLKNLNQIRDYGRKHKDKIIEAAAISRSGYNYRALSLEKSLEYCLKGLELAQETGNETLLALTKMNLSYTYRDLGEFQKSISLMNEVVKHAGNSKFYKAQTWAYGGLAHAYLQMGKPESSLAYGEKCYALCKKIGYFDFIGYRLIVLGEANAKLGNNAEAIRYYDLAIKDAYRIKSPKQLNNAFTAKAKYYLALKMIDSSALYARKSVKAVFGTPFSNYALTPSKMLLDIYKPVNSDSALKYSEIYRITNDSLFNTKAIQQTQLMTFEDNIRQQRIAEEKEQAEEDRQQNIRYALIAFGILVFVSLFLLYSRTVIANEKWISFFGIVALLIVFEFLNLLLHPLLARITHHNAFLMLLAMVGIAAVLVPLHHKIEHWATKKLIEKNKEIRLANAKKTIEELDIPSETI